MLVSGGTQFLRKRLVIRAGHNCAGVRSVIPNNKNQDVGISCGITILAQKVGDKGMTLSCWCQKWDRKEKNQHFGVRSDISLATGW